MSHHAVLDRIVDGLHAVLLVGPDETEFVLPVAQLPPDAKPGDWLRVILEDGELTDLAVDAEATAAAQARIADKLARLRARGRKLPPSS